MVLVIQGLVPTRNQSKKERITVRNLIQVLRGMPILPFVRHRVFQVLALNVVLIQSTLAASWDSSLSGLPYTGTAVTIAGSDVYAATTDANATYLYKWSGGSWSYLTEGRISPGSAIVNAIKVVDGYIYVGGKFDGVGETTSLNVNNIARYKLADSTWAAVGSGVDYLVRAIDAATNWTTGEVWIYVGGHFTNSGTITLNNIGRFHHLNTDWQSIGGGVHESNSADGDVAAGVTALVAWQNPKDDGLTLYAAGGFDAAGSLAVTNIARWNDDGNAWKTMGLGLTAVGFCNDCPNNCTKAVGYIWDHGPYAKRMASSGSRIYISGTFNRVHTNDAVLCLDQSACGYYQHMGVASLNLDRSHFSGGTLSPLPGLIGAATSTGAMTVRKVGTTDEMYVASFELNKIDNCNGPIFTGTLAMYSTATGTWVGISGAPSGTSFGDMASGSPGAAPAIVMVGDFGSAGYRP